jgi:hypothetical protein
MMKNRASEEFRNFDALLTKVMSVPKTEILRREAEYERVAAQNPKRRGRKRKIKPSASPVPVSS